MHNCIRKTLTSGQTTNDPNLRKFFSAISLPDAYQGYRCHPDYKATQDIPREIQDLVKGLIIYYRSAERGWRGVFDRMTNYSQNKQAQKFLGQLGPGAAALKKTRSAFRFELELFESTNNQLASRRQAFIRHPIRFRDERLFMDIDYELRLTVVGNRGPGSVGGQLGEKKYEDKGFFAGAGKKIAQLQAFSPASGRDSSKHGGIWQNMKKRWHEVGVLHETRWYKCGRYVSSQNVFYNMLPRSPEALRVISKALADDVLWHQGIGERVYRAGKLIGKLGGIASIGVTTGGVAYGGPAALAAPGLMAQAGGLVMGSAAVPAVQGAGLAMQAKDIGAYGRAPLRAYRKMKRDFYGLRRNEQRAFIDKGLAPSGYMFIKFNGKLKLTVFVRGV